MTEETFGPVAPILPVKDLDAFREAKHVHIGSEVKVKEWWYPYG